jgi:hypothetical protein
MYVGLFQGSLLFQFLLFRRRDNPLLLSELHPKERKTKQRKTGGKNRQTKEENRQKENERKLKYREKERQC